MNGVNFQVHGLPQPRGSKRPLPNKATGRVMMVDSNPKSKPWMAAVSSEAAAAMNGRPLLEGPLLLTATFFFPRPKSHFGTGKNAAFLKAVAPTYHGTKPDADKLVRALGDAMTGVVYRDDSQIAVLQIQKEYSMTGGKVTVHVSQMIED